MNAPPLNSWIKFRIVFGASLLATEKLYLHWIRFFIRWSVLRHLKNLAAPEVEAFLTMLASRR